MWKECWDPPASLAPAVIPYVSYVLSRVPSLVCLLSAFWQRWSDCLSLLSPSGSPGWQRKSGGDGAWRRFEKSFSVFCELRLGQLVCRQHTWLPLPSGPFISYCAPLFVVTLPMTLGCRGFPVRVINTGCVLYLSLLRGMLRTHTGIIHWVEIDFMCRNRISEWILAKSQEGVGLHFSSTLKFIILLWNSALMNIDFFCFSSETGAARTKGEWLYFPCGPNGENNEAFHHP